MLLCQQYGDWSKSSFNSFLAAFAYFTMFLSPLCLSYSSRSAMRLMSSSTFFMYAIAYLFMVVSSESVSENSSSSVSVTLYSVWVSHAISSSYSLGRYSCLSTSASKAMMMSLSFNTSRMTVAPYSAALADDFLLATSSVISFQVSISIVAFKLFMVRFLLISICLLMSEPYISSVNMSQPSSVCMC